MNIVFRCQCGLELQAEKSSIGQQVVCPNCNSPLIVPPPANQPDPLLPLQPLQSPPLQPLPPVQPSYGYQSPLKGRRRKRSAPAGGIVTGVLAIVLGIGHFLCGGFTGIAMMFVRTAQSVANVDPTVPGAKNLNAGVDGFFQVAQMSMGMTLFIAFAMGTALIVGAIGLFRTSMWGWITTLITAILALIIAAVISYGYFQTLSHFSNVEQVSEAAVEMSKSFTEQQKQFVANNVKGVRNQIHFSYIPAIVAYAGFGITAVILLVLPKTFAAYRMS